MATCCAVAAVLGVTPACKTVPAHVEAAVAARRATEFAASGDIAHAMDEASLAVGLMPDRLDYLRARVRYFAKAGALDDLASEYLRQAGEPDAKAATAHYALGLITAARGPDTTEAAAAHWLRAKAAAPHEAEFAYRLGALYFSEEDFARAEPLLAEAIRLQPTEPSFYLAHVRALAALGRTPEALAELETLIQLQPGESTVKQAARLSSRMSDPFVRLPVSTLEDFDKGINLLEKYELPQDAQVVFEQLSMAHPSVGVFVTYLGLCKGKLNNAVEAIALFDRAMALDPRSPMPHLAKGDIFFGLRKFEQAQASYERAVGLDPFHSLAHHKLAEAYMASGKARQAIAPLKRVVLLTGGNLRARSLLAQAMEQAGETDLAEAEYRAIAERDANHAAIWMKLTALAVNRAAGAPDEAERRKAFLQAEEYLNQALTHEPENAAAHELRDRIEKNLEKSGRKSK